MTPHEIKFRLEQQLLKLARGGPVPQIVGLHSVTVENNTVLFMFDIAPDSAGGGSGLLFFEFELTAPVNRVDLRAFGEWLASSGFTGAVH